MSDAKAPAKYVVPDIYQWVQQNAMNLLKTSPPLFHVRLGCSEVFRMACTDPKQWDCRICAKWLCTYADTVLIDEKTFELVPLFWTKDQARLNQLLPECKKAAAAVADHLDSATAIQSHVTPTKGAVWGTEQYGGFSHFSFTFPEMKYKVTDSAEVKTLKDMLDRVESDYDATLLAKAHLYVLEAKIHRSEIVKPMLDWWVPKQFQLESKLQNEVKRRNAKWLWAATAPVGFVNSLRSGACSQFLELVGKLEKKEITEKDLQNSWNAIVYPMKYQRTTAAPSEGLIKMAEKKMQEMGITKADLERYRMKSLPLELICAESLVWHRSSEKSEDAKDAKAVGDLKDAKAVGDLKDAKAGAKAPPSGMSHEEPPKALFSNVIAKQKEDKPKEMTWTQFMAVAKKAKNIELKVQDTIAFCEIITGAPNSKPLMQWHTEQNTVSWYCKPTWIKASEANLVEGKWEPVQAIVKRPDQWAKATADDLNYFIWLKNAHAAVGNGNCLFPECLKAELHSIRRVIEAFSNKTQIKGDGGVCGTTLFRSTGDNIMGGPYVFRLEMPTSTMTIQVSKYN